MNKRFAVLAMLCVVIGGCATAPTPRTVVNKFSYNASIDTVWTATVETFAEMNLPIDNIEKDSGLIATDWINFTGTGNKDYCDCGGLGLAIENLRRGKFNVFVKQTGNAVDARVNVHYQQTASLDNTPFTRDCVSTGALEARINELIGQKIGK